MSFKDVEQGYWTPTPSPAPAAPEEAEGPSQMLEFWRSIQRNKWSILGLTGLIVVVTAVLVSLQTPIYRSTATIMIESGKTKVLSVDEVYSSSGGTRENFLTQAELIRSRDVALRVIDKLKLMENPEFDPRQAKTGFLGGIIGSMGGDGGNKLTDEDVENAVLGAFFNRLKVEPSRSSQLIKVSFESENRQLAAQVANTVAEAFIQADLDTRFKMTQQAGQWLNSRLASLREKLDASERALQSYREREGILDVKGDALTGTVKQLEDVTSRLVEARVRRMEAEHNLEQVRAAKSGNIEAAPAIARNPLVIKAKELEAEAEKRLAEMSQRYGPDHPKRSVAEAELKAAKDNARRQVETVTSTINKEYEVARAAERSIEGVLGAARGNIQGINRKEIQLSQLEREVSANRQLYQMFLNRFKETSSAGDMQSLTARVVEEAVPSQVPARPVRGQIIGVAGVLGLLLSIVLALLMDRLDNTLKTSSDVETKLKQPVLTTLPVLTSKMLGAGGAARLYLDEPHGVFSESIRTARTGVMLSAVDDAHKVIAVTSSIPGEGKSTFAINLALAHAQTKKTILLEADMRKPTAAKYLNLPVGQKGLSELVAGDVPISECTCRVEGSDLVVMPAGQIPPNPLELLLSRRFKDLLARLREQYEVVVVDTPPVQAVSDAVVVSALASEVAYVVKADETPYQLARSGLKRLQAADANLIGVVLNHLDFKKAERYYGEHGGYGKYGKNYRYGTENRA